MCKRERVRTARSPQPRADRAVIHEGKASGDAVCQVSGFCLE